MLLSQRHVRHTPSCDTCLEQVPVPYPRYMTWLLLVAAVGVSLITYTLVAEFGQKKLSWTPTTVIAVLTIAAMWIFVLLQVRKLMEFNKPDPLYAFLDREGCLHIHTLAFMSRHTPMFCDKAHKCVLVFTTWAKETGDLDLVHDHIGFHVTGRHSGDGAENYTSRFQVTGGRGLGLTVKETTSRIEFVIKDSEVRASDSPFNHFRFLFDAVEAGGFTLVKARAEECTEARLWKESQKRKEQMLDMQFIRLLEAFMHTYAAFALHGRPRSQPLAEARRKLHVNLLQFVQANVGYFTYEKVSRLWTKYVRGAYTRSLQLTAVEDVRTWVEDNLSDGVEVWHEAELPMPLFLEALGRPSVLNGIGFKPAKQFQSLGEDPPPWNPDRGDAALAA